MTELIEIRHKLHSIAEISGNEKQTSEMIVALLKETNPNRIVTNIGGYGIIAEYLGTDSTKTIMLRADMDALPIAETNSFDHISSNSKVSHKCGHDGHITILIGLARQLNNLLAELPCRVLLLFQPAEENADGAFAVINDEKFKQFEPDYIFGLHNLPGFPLSSIVVKNNVFASASKGLSARFIGATSHAGHPENGRSPVLAMTNLINGLIAIPSLHTKLENAANITIIYANIGEIAFGTSPGEAVVMATFRSHRNEDMAKMTEQAIKMIEGLANIYDLKYEIEWIEEFPSTLNDNDCTEIILASAKQLGNEVVLPEIPFPWSEDFGWYLKHYKGAFFGLGSGTNCPQLHNADYDFPDEIINEGINIFRTIIERAI